jgi:hypothetical protein
MKINRLSEQGQKAGLMVEAKILGLLLSSKERQQSFSSPERAAVLRLTRPSRKQKEDGFSRQVTMNKSVGGLDEHDWVTISSNLKKSN